MKSGNLPHDYNGQTDGPEWDHITDFAKDLISKLLKVNPDERLESAAILHHPWFLSDPLTCSQSRNVMFDTEDSLRLDNEAMNNESNLKMKCSDHCVSPG